MIPAPHGPRATPELTERRVVIVTTRFMSFSAIASRQFYSIGWGLRGLNTIVMRLARKGLRLTQEI